MALRAIWPEVPWTICYIILNTCKSVRRHVFVIVYLRQKTSSDKIRSILYIYCMLVREIWKLIHPRVSYSPRARVLYFPRGIWYSWVNKFAYFLNPHAMNILLYRMKPRKHIHVKYCWQTYFKSIGTLPQTFKNHIHNNIVKVACKWCVLSASDVFLSKNDNSGRKTEVSEGVEYDIFFTEYDFCPVWSRVLIFTYCPIKLIYWWLLIYEDLRYNKLKYWPATLTRQIGKIKT